MKPRLSRSQVEQLRQYCLEGIEVDEVYGVPIGSVTGAFTYVWLEAGIMAGYAPHLDAFELALRACHLWVADEVQRDRTRGLDTFGWLRSNADAYRGLIAVLEDLVIDFEQQLAADYRTGPQPNPPRVRRDWAEEIAAADKRAAEAQRRRDSALADGAETWRHARYAHGLGQQKLDVNTSIGGEDINLRERPTKRIANDDEE